MERYYSFSGTENGPAAERTMPPIEETNHEPQTPTKRASQTRQKSHTLQITHRFEMQSDFEGTPRAILQVKGKKESKKETSLNYLKTTTMKNITTHLKRSYVTNLTYKDLSTAYGT
jgi:hypothetical protein